MMGTLVVKRLNVTLFYRHVLSSRKHVSSKVFVDIQATIECRFTLKRLRDMIITYRHPLIFLWIYLDFISLHIFCWIFSQTCMSHHGWEKFSNLWCSSYWKIYFQVKILTLDIFIHAPTPSNSPCSQNCPPGSTITPQVTMTWNVRLFMFYMIYNFFKCDDFIVL